MSKPIDLTRDKPRQHLAFGSGIHLCLGNLLSRAEMKIAYEEILKRWRNLRFAGAPTYEPSFLAYGPRTLPVSFDAALEQAAASA